MNDSILRARKPGGLRVHRRRRLAAIAGFCALASTALTGSSSAVSGNINPSAIQIENAGKADLVSTTASANVYNSGATLDWIKDSTGNTGTGCLGTDAIATCDEPGVTAATGGTGHWNGVRIVDGISQGDQDIFLNGGKEGDTSTWNVGPGSVGSSKYDATQMYLANNQTDLFFGMERSGNNGTTAFDFEFNRNAPVSTYVPTRTVGDVLFTFEMQGSGGSGSVTPHFYRYTSSGYSEQALPAGTFASINDNTTTAGEPWGHVDSHGNWVTGNLDRNTFAEAIVNLANVFPGFNVCTANSAYVEIRTRSAATDTSDLKDTTKIFNYDFNPPASPSTQLASTCQQTFTYNSPGTAASWAWDFVVSASQATAGVTLGGTGVTGPVTATNGDKIYHSTSQSGTVNVNLPVGVGSASIDVSQTVTSAATSCTAGDGPYTVTVYRVLGATATLTPQCNNHFAYASTVSGGNAPYTYAWTFQKNISGVWTNEGTSALDHGTFDATTAGQGQYRALLTVTDTAATSAFTSVTPKGVCTVDATSNSINVYNAVGSVTTLSSTCATPDIISYTATGSGGNGTYNYSWTIQKNTGTPASPVWVTAGTFTDGPKSGASTGTFDVDSFVTNNGDGIYRALVTVTDTQGLSCHVDDTSNTIEAAHALGASAVKTSADGSAMSVLLTGTATNGGSAPTYQWQRQTGASTWTNISGATSATLTYSSFETDATPTATTFTIGSDSYNGKQWTVVLRVHITRTLNGSVCSADSSAVTVKKVQAVDP